MATNTDDKILEKIRNSDYYKDFINDLRAKYSDVTEGSVYTYKPEDFSSGYLVVVKISCSDDTRIDLIFRMNDDNEIVDAEADVDELSEVGKPRKVDEYLDTKQGIREKVESIRENR